MALTRRDAGATATVALGALVVVANVRNWGLPLVGGDRASIAALALVGAGMYALCPPTGEPFDAVTTALDVLGVGAIFLIVAGLAIGTHVLMLTLLGVLLLVWLVLTVRHRHRAAGPGPGRRRARG